MPKIKVSYGFYYETYCKGNKGLLQEKNFDAYTDKAWRELKFMLNGEYGDELLETIKLTLCEIAEELYRTNGMADKKSESIDGYSVTYADNTLIRKNIARIALRNLGDTGLLYMGVEN